MSRTEAEGIDMARVLMICAEAAPYAKVGGLGDVVGTLPRRLAEVGLSVAVYIPYYDSIRAAGLQPAMTTEQLVIDHAGEPRRIRVAFEEAEGVEFFFIDEPHYFQRDGIYGPHGGDYPDNAQRYSFLVRASLASAALNRKPDVIHCHDWHAALAPVYLRSGPAPAGWDRIPVILTIHNLAHQGIFNSGVFGDLGLPPRAYSPDCLEHFGSINFLKGGIITADYVTTVSPTYAREISGPELGFGLDGVLSARGSNLLGITNGIDYGVWNPLTDRSLAVPFDREDLGSRSAGRERIREELGLDSGGGSPLFAFVGRLVHQKGADLLAGVIPEMVKGGMQVAVLGSGQAELEDWLRSLAASYPGRVSVNIGFHESLSRRIYAGSDFFVMPSRFEPCGLGQMMAMRYGSLPVVRRTGGLVDTVFDVDSHPKKGNGFLFDKPEGGDLLEAVKRAARFFRSDSMAEVVERAMSQDNSWRRAAGQYAELYARALGKSDERAPAGDGDG